MGQTQDPRGILGANDCRRRYLPQSKFSIRLQSHDRPVTKEMRICRITGAPDTQFLTGGKLFTRDL